MIVENIAARVISLGLTKGKDVDLMPGVNDIPDDAWREAETHPAVKGMIADGTLRVQPGRVDLARMKPEEAAALVAKTFDRKTLEGWASQEKRAPVSRAIEDQLAAITPKPEKPNGDRQK